MVRRNLAHLCLRPFGRGVGMPYCQRNFFTSNRA